MPYETVIEQVKMLPEPLLAGDFTENYTKQAKPKDKQAFFALAGKVHLDQYTVTELREASLI